VPGAYNAT
jgi:intraflagellar transport protein 46